ncbi:MAG: hypothetical protein ABEJ74_08205 [Haloferacaceae archaeon]
MGTATKGHRRAAATADEGEQPEMGLFLRFLQALAPPDEWVAAHSHRD